MDVASGTPSPGAKPRVWRILALVLCALFLASVARFYHPGFGFTSLVVIPSAGHDSEIPALRALPHYEYATIAYDGEFYVQLAMTPLLRDPAIDRALDRPAFRARRILFCWTAYALGFGRPAWILQVYALQNVLCWLVLAWLITRWIPLTAEAPSRCGPGACSAMGCSGPSASRCSTGRALLLAIAVLAAEQNRTWVTAALVGVAGLGRETNCSADVRRFRGRTAWRDWLKLAAALALVILPLVIWQDYIWSIYRGTSTSCRRRPVDRAAQRPTSGQMAGSPRAIAAGTASGLCPGFTLLVLIAISVQLGFLVVTLAWREPWWRLAAAYAGLMT